MNEKKELTLSKKELYIIHNALNEIYNGVEIPEFELRIGASEGEVEALLKKFGALFDQASE